MRPVLTGSFPFVVPSCYFVFFCYCCCCCCAVWPIRSSVLRRLDNWPRQGYTHTHNFSLLFSRRFFVSLILSLYTEPWSIVGRFPISSPLEMPRRVWLALGVLWCLRLRQQRLQWGMMKASEAHSEIELARIKKGRQEWRPRFFSLVT